MTAQDLVLGRDCYGTCCRSTSCIEQKLADVTAFKSVHADLTAASYPANTLLITSQADHEKWGVGWVLIKLQAVSSQPLCLGFHQKFRHLDWLTHSNMPQISVSWLHTGAGTASEPAGSCRGGGSGWGRFLPAGQRSRIGHAWHGGREPLRRRAAAGQHARAAGTAACGALSHLPQPFQSHTIALRPNVVQLSAGEP